MQTAPKSTEIDQNQQESTAVDRSKRTAKAKPTVMLDINELKQGQAKTVSVQVSRTPTVRRRGKLTVAPKQPRPSDQPAIESGELKRQRVNVARIAFVVVFLTLAAVFFQLM